MGNKRFANVKPVSERFHSHALKRKLTRFFGFESGTGKDSVGNLGCLAPDSASRTDFTRGGGDYASRVTLIMVERRHAPAEGKAITEIEL